MPERLGRRHPLVRRLRQLRRDAAFRREEGVYLAEGTHLVEEALSRPADVELIVVGPSLASRPGGSRLLERIGRLDLACHEVDDPVLEGLQDARSPQPALALVRRCPRSVQKVVELGATPALIVVACGLQDPGNLGSLLRTAEAAGATGCIVCGSSADPYHPRAARASAGSILRLPLAFADVDELLPLLRERGLVTLGSAAHDAQSYEGSDLARPLALFLGGEGSGLPVSLLERLDERIRIPMRAGVESLSVGAAAAVLLFEAGRQRRAAGQSSSLR